MSSVPVTSNPDRESVDRSGQASYGKREPNTENAHGAVAICCQIKRGLAAVIPLKTALSLSQHLRTIRRCTIDSEGYRTGTTRPCTSTAGSERHSLVRFGGLVDGLELFEVAGTHITARQRLGVREDAVSELSNSSLTPSIPRNGDVPIVSGHGDLAPLAEPEGGLDGQLFVRHTDLDPIVVVVAETRHAGGRRASANRTSNVAATELVEETAGSAGGGFAVPAKGLTDTATSSRGADPRYKFSCVCVRPRASGGRSSEACKS